MQPLKLLFHYPIFNSGGAEMSSMRLMKALADRGHNITLVVTTGCGNLENKLDPRIRLVRLRPAAFGNKFKTAGDTMSKLLAFPDLLAYIACRLIGALRMLPFFFVRYTAAITLLQGTSTWFIRKIVNAKTRLHWIRSDLGSSDPSGVIADKIRRAEPEIDYYVCVSEVARNSLVLAVPAAKRKAIVVYNILDTKMMCDMSMEDAPHLLDSNDGIIKILTVCRLSEASKGLTRMAKVCKKLKDSGKHFVWYVIGEGKDRALLENAIKEADISNCMKLLGHVENPFPAYRNANVVAMLSHFEGLSGVINEAKVCGRAVIATKVSGVDEQLTNEVNGLVVENNEDAIIEGMLRILSDKALRQKLENFNYPSSLLDDEAKLDKLETMFINRSFSK